MISLPADQAAREQALSPRGSFHLEAPAGSGKTSVLLARFLTLLARVEAPEELLALTFTRKAAGELRTRVMELLWTRPESSRKQPWEQSLNDLAHKVLANFGRQAGNLQELLTAERLPVMTFHSLCAQLLRLAPQEAGIPLEFRLLEEHEFHRLMEEALEELRRNLAARPERDPVRQALVRRLVRLNNDWGRLAGELRSLLARRDSLGDFLELARHSREPEAYHQLLEERFRLALAPLLQDLADGFAAGDLGREWPRLREELGGTFQEEILSADLPGPAPQDLPAWQTISRVLLTQNGDRRKQLTVRNGFPAAFNRNHWARLIQALPDSLVRYLKQCRDLEPVGVHLEEAQALQDLVILLGEALSAYEGLCAQRQALDFIGLEQATLRLLNLENPGDLLLRLDLRLRHLLVDEFQDTSQNQMELLCRLTAGWQAGEGRTLTVVGDPKQSIYGWRQAKPRLFAESSQGLPCPEGRFPLESLLLTTNFRATRTLIDWANDVFASVLAGVPGLSFHASHPRPGALEGPSPKLALFAGGENLSSRESEARWLARQVGEACSQLAEKETIGILLFTRTHLPVYLQALAEAGLTPRVREGLKLADSQVVQHLHNLARALVRPQDELAWAALLRGPWAPQPLSVLVQVAQTTGELWPEKLRSFAGTEACPGDLANLIDKLLAALAQVGRQPLAATIGQWLDEMDAWSGLATWERAMGVACARAYLELLAQAEFGLPEATFTQADFTLAEAFQPPDPQAQDSPVEILTVHRAKGLEFTRVFLPFLDWQSLQGESKIPPFLLEEIPGHRLQGLALARPYAQEKQSSLYRLLKNLKDRRLLEEARRVFYVAVTRARQHLVLSAAVKLNNQGDWTVPRESPLAWLLGHYQTELPAVGITLTWPGPELEVEVVGEGPPLPSQARIPTVLEPPLPFSPEAAPYRISFPSQLAEAEIRAEVAALENPEIPRLRGEIIHRGLDTLARGGELPGLPALAAALRQMGLPPEAAAALAPELLAELQACRLDPWLAPFLDPERPGAVSEWLLEDLAAPNTLRRGKIDRLVFDGHDWWLLDYKSSRPGNPADWEDFINREAARYRPQLMAYREMAAGAKGLRSEEIRLAFYFTACQRAVEV
ncbi:MAG: UvrD-helicase domain-containing protein [Desulfobaccales bacterium]|jgi:ATP-dependent exoDNAse (exonuclease V) beta subunit